MQKRPSFAIRPRLIASLLLGLLLAPGIPLDAAEDVRFQRGNVLVNGSFESDLNQGWGTGQYSEGRPVWWNSGGCRSRAVIDERVVRRGSRSLKIINPSTAGPHIYGTTNQRIEVLPNHPYRIKLDARAQDLKEGAVSIVVDERWKVRPLVLPGGSYDWRELTADFMLRSKRAEFRILVENSGTVWLDDIQVHALDPAATPQDRGEDNLSASQKYVLEKLGRPEVFHIFFSGPDRIETWLYHRYYATFSFKNGTFQRQRFELEPIPAMDRLRLPEISPVAIHPRLNPQELAELIGTQTWQFEEEQIGDQRISICLYQRGVSASYDDTGRMLTFLAYPYESND